MPDHGPDGTMQPNTRPVLTANPIPPRAGVGLKPEHYRQILDDAPDIGWFEVHAENFMGAGGAPHRYLTAIRERYPLSVHGVGLSIGAAGALDKTHLDRLQAVCARYQPGLVSEHLAWSTHEGRYLNDLLPVPYTAETLARVSEHIDQLQSILGRQILLENPSTYVLFADSEMSELDFLAEIVRTSGCGLLLDVNNVYVSAINHGFAPETYLDAFPFTHVGELHLGGHAEDSDDDGQRLLIDAHGTPIADPVWALYTRTLEHMGAVPTLIEWDNDVPTWPRLFGEAQRAERLLIGMGAAHASVA